MDFYKDSDKTDRQSPLCILKSTTCTGFLETGAFYAFRGKKRNKLSFKLGTFHGRCLIARIWEKMLMNDVSSL